MNTKFWKANVTQNRHARKRSLACANLFFVIVATSIVIGAMLPQAADAFSIRGFLREFFGLSREISAEEPTRKPFPFLSAIAAIESRGPEHEVPLEIIGGTALAPAVGPLGNVVDAAESAVSYKISLYTVREGDTLSGIAESFGVSVSTIRWANDITRDGVVKEGDTLTILPVSGVRHTVRDGDTILSISKKYGGDPDDILDFNSLSAEDRLVVGSIVIVPDGEVAVPVVSSRIRASGPDLGGYYSHPLDGTGVRTRGIHGYNGVDLASPLGTPVYAAQEGTVITSRGIGWNGGYGSYIAISHANGTQTLYAHLQSISVSQGQFVSKGHMIGTVGTSGKSTGPHLHFEVRGAKNPF